MFCTQLNLSPRREPRGRAPVRRGLRRRRPLRHHRRLGEFLFISTRAIRMTSCFLTGRDGRGRGRSLRAVLDRTEQLDGQVERRRSRENSAGGKRVLHRGPVSLFLFWLFLVIFGNLRTGNCIDAVFFTTARDIRPSHRRRLWVSFFQLSYGQLG